MYGADTHMDTHTGRGSDFMVGLLCGTAVGAAIGLLLAPKAGSQLRHDLVDSAEKLRRRASEAYNHASETASNMADKGRQAVRRGREKFDDARDAFNEEVQQAGTETNY